MAEPRTETYTVSDPVGRPVWVITYYLREQENTPT